MDTTIKEEEKETPKEQPKDEFDAFRVHINRLPTKDLRTHAKEAWSNQEGSCILTDKLLKKSKVILTLFRPKEPEKFEGMEILPALIHEDYLKKPKALLEVSVKKFWYDLFEVEMPLPDLTPKTLTPEQEAMIAKLQKDHVHDENCEHDH